MAEAPFVDTRKYLKYAVLILAIFGLLLAFANLGELKERFLVMNLLCFSVALALSLTVYFVEGFFLRISLSVFDVDLPLSAAFKYSFLINSLGYLFSLGGLTPFATQAYFLGFHSVNAKKATLGRIVHVIFFNISFNILFIAGFSFMLAANEVHGFNRPLLFVVLCAFVTGVTFFYATIFAKPFQKVVVKGACSGANAVLGVFSRFFSRFFKRSRKVPSEPNPRPAVRLDERKAIAYFDEFASGFKKLLKDPRRLLTLSLITIFDILLWLFILFFSFSALRYSIHPGVLFIGFAVGQIVSVATMVPGGVGTMEGSMSIVYSLFGVPFEIALGAVLIYRFVFYVIPVIASVPLHLSLRRIR